MKRTKVMKMNKKIIVTIISICFFTMGANSVFALNLNEKIVRNTQKIVTENKAIDENIDIVFQAYGPVRKITTFEFLNGSETEIQLINEMMSKRLFYPMFPAVAVKNLTFNITFTEAVKNYSRYWYVTSYVDEENNLTTTINKPHGYTVKNFTGVFIFIKPKIFRFLCIGPKFFRPYRFMILGHCENITSKIVIT